MTAVLSAHPPAIPGFWPCRWDWCRATFPARDALIEHIKHHTSAAPPLTRAALNVIERMEASQEYTQAEGTLGLIPCICYSQLMMLSATKPHS